MKKVRLFGLASLVLMLSLFRAEVFAYSCNEQNPPMLGCVETMPNWFCEEQDQEYWFTFCQDLCWEQHAELYQEPTCTDNPNNDFLYCVCWLNA